MNTVQMTLLAGAFSIGQAWAADHAGLPPIPDETLNEDQLLTVLEIMNTGEIQQSEFALRQATHRNIKGLAQQLLDDHAVSNARIEELKGEGYDPQSSELSEQITAQAEDRLEAVIQLDAAEFDCVFIADQMGQHQRAMQLVSRQLESAAPMSEPVRSFLDQTLVELEGHGNALQTLLDQDICPQLQDDTP